MLKSKQTGFIHYNYHARDQRHDTIPVVENACHILELLRTKQAENLYEAKFLLEKLLAFQAPSGNFPQYLHEYPTCYDGLCGFYLLAPFFHIQKEFHAILPKTLKLAMEKLQNYCRGVSYAGAHHKALLAASLGERIGPLDADKASVWSDLLVARAMLDQPPALDQLAKKWHAPTQTFLGLSELQEKKAPQPTLLDLFMGKELPGHPLNLQKSLVKPITLPNLNSSTLIYRPIHEPKPFQKDFHLMCWEGLVCQNSQHNVTCTGLLQMDFTYPSALPEKDDKHMEVQFFYPHDGKTLPATTFKLGEPLHMGPFILTFQPLCGSGDFYGHISRGNRPAQTCTQTAYDWQIGLRTIRRTPDFKLRVTIERVDLNA